MCCTSSSTFLCAVPAAQHLYVLYQQLNIFMCCTSSPTFLCAVPAAQHFYVLYQQLNIFMCCTSSSTFLCAVPAAQHFYVLYQQLNIFLTRLSNVSKNCQSHSLPLVREWIQGPPEYEAAGLLTNKLRQRS